MKTILKLLIVCGIIVLTAFSCKKEQSNPCNETGDGTTVETFDFFDINTPYAWVQNVDENETIVNLIIQNQQNYEKYVGIRSDTLRPEIDFEKFVLLAGMIKTSSSDTVIEQSVTKKCDTYTYKIVVGNGNLGVVSKVYYFAIVEKVTGNVIFNVKYKNK